MNVVRLVSRRYGFSTQNRHRATNIRTLVSIALCVCAMLLSLSFMQSLSNGQLSRIRTFETFDGQIRDVDRDTARSLARKIDGEAGMRAFAFSDRMAMVAGPYGSAIVTLRTLDPSAPLWTTLGIDAPAGYWMGRSLAFQTGIASGTVDLSVLEAGKVARVVPRTSTVPLAGLYASGDVVLDRAMILEAGTEGEGGTWQVGIVGSADRATIASLTGGTGTYLSWKEINDSLYHALMLEKGLVRSMFFLLVLVVLCSISRSVRRLGEQKRQEIGMLETMGMSQGAVRAVFFREALMVSLAGLCFGLLGCRAILTWFFPWFSRHASSYLFRQMEALTMPWDSVLAIAVFVLGGTLVSVWFGMRKSSRLSLVEMLQDV